MSRFIVKYKNMLSLGDPKVIPAPSEEGAHTIAEKLVTLDPDMMAWVVEVEADHESE